MFILALEVGIILKFTVKCQKRAISIEARKLEIKTRQQNAIACSCTMRAVYSSKSSSLPRRTKVFGMNSSCVLTTYEGERDEIRSSPTIYTSEEKYERMFSYSLRYCERKMTREKRQRAYSAARRPRDRFSTHNLADSQSVVSFYCFDVFACNFD